MHIHDALVSSASESALTEAEAEAGTSGDHHDTPASPVHADGANDVVDASSPASPKQPRLRRVGREQVLSGLRKSALARSFTTPDLFRGMLHSHRDPTEDQSRQTSGSEQTDSPRRTPSALLRVRRLPQTHAHGPRFQMKVPMGKSKLGYDGADDEQFAARPSVSHDYSSATQVWERAFTNHKATLEADKQKAIKAANEPPLSTRKRLSVWLEPPAPRKPSQAGDSGMGDRKQSFVEFKPMQTRLTTDRLLAPHTMPARSSGSRQQSNQHFRLDLFSRAGAAGADPTANKNLEEEPDPQTLEHPAIRADTRKKLATVTEAQGSQENEAKDRSSWARFPEHSRHDRNASAGAEDGVDVRDFAVIAEVADDESVEPTQPSKRQKLATLKARGAHLRKVVLNDVPEFFKPFAFGFHRGERGHRSSISMSGALEYPDLELLPGRETKTPVPVAARRLSSYGSETRKSLSKKASISHPPNTDGHKSRSDSRQASAVGSSNYDESEEHQPRSP